MAVESEQFFPADLTLTGQARVEGLRRRKDGTYIFDIFVDYEAAPGDGRRMRLNGHFNLPATHWSGKKRPALRPTGT